MATNRNLFQEGLHVGLGLALRTKEMVEEFGRKITKQYEMTEEEGQRFVDDLLTESEETQTRLDEIIQKRMEAYADEAGLARRKDIDDLSKKLDKLEKELGKSK
jgi:polyhydroxyalkanoate synthesis regulator phasin